MRTTLGLALILAAAPAVAGTTRLAIVFGHNGGAGGRAPLRYAETDAARVAKVLLETGRVERPNLKLLQGRPLAELFAALEWAAARAKAEPVLLVVYLSAHATAQDGLLPGAEQVAWKTLKRRVAATGAKARVTIVDACQSSGIVEAAAKEAPAFTIEAEDRLTVQGDAFITSSAASEPSLEAGQLRGSVFTQHLVAGLRGAADTNQDGAVSLDEAYRFAYERTLAGESGQHPGLAVRLAGYGELTLSQVRDEGPGLLVPTAAERLVVRDPATRDVVLSAVRPVGQRLVLPSGTFLVELEREGQRREGRVEVPSRGFGVVDEGQLTVRAAAGEGLVRLGHDAQRCPPIEVPTPLPVLRSLADALQPALERLCATRAVRAPVLTREGPGVTLTFELDERAVRLTGPRKSLEAALEELAVAPH